MCNLKEFGGLGIIDLRLRNRALLNKWLWRFSKERDSKWRSVIVKKNEIDERALIPTRGRDNRCFTMWRTITSPLFNNDSLSVFTKGNMAVCLGNGTHIDFWNEAWAAEQSLKELFPRVYALAAKKSGRVYEFGGFNDNVWQWRIETRRPLFDWEREQWINFMKLLDEQVVTEEMEDLLIWKPNPSGEYSSKSFCYNFLSQFQRRNKGWNLVWSDLAPPKVEIFVWQVMKGRIAVKEELLKRRLIHSDVAWCPLCKNNIESVSHLLFTCYFSWSLWMSFCHMLEVEWVIPGDPLLFFIAWQHAGCKKGLVQVWRMAFFAITWSIWLYRNDIVFNGKLFDSMELLSTIKIRLAWWVKAKWPELQVSLMDIYRQPDLALIKNGKQRKKRIAEWRKPPEGFMKFNVDGAARGKPGPAGIGGLLRDNSGKVWVEFSRAVERCESNEAEVLAIKEAVLIFSASSWASSHGLVLESDSSNAVKWISNPRDSPWKFRRWIAQICGLKKNLISFQIQHTLREANSEADYLAKTGVDREDTWMQFFT